VSVPDHGAAELGDSLRAARQSLGLTLERAQADTRIRGRYLVALEEGRFDELPGDAYARGFLGAYAAYLGLDRQRYLSTYRSLRQAEEPAVVSLPVAPPRRPLHPGLLAGAAAVALGLGAWQLDGRRGGEEAQTPQAPRPRVTVTLPAAAEQPPAAAAAKSKPAPAAPAVLVLTALHGDCWLDVRIGGPDGKRAWTGTLRQGRTLRLGLGRPLHLVAGASHVLAATVSGRAVPVPPGAGTLTVTRDGIRAG
jgi:cytoskeleton protein RodZ